MHRKFTIGYSCHMQMKMKCFSLTSAVEKFDSESKQHHKKNLLSNPYIQVAYGLLRTIERSCVPVRCFEICKPFVETRKYSVFFSVTRK